MGSSTRTADWVADTPSQAEERESPLEVRRPTPDARCVESPLTSLGSPITPTDHFFIRSHFATPHVELETWRLHVEGHVERPLVLSHRELRRMERRKVTALLECAGNSRAFVRPRAEGVLWRHGAVGTADWSGVSLGAVLERAGVRPGATEVVFEGLDRGREPGVVGELGFGMSISLVKALDPDTLLADEMNGRPLRASHGYPLRSIVPGWYGMASVKWLSRIRVLDRPYSGYFRTRAYAFIPEGDAAGSPKAPVTTVRVKSIILSPREGHRLDQGSHTVRGAAWSGEGQIVRVEVCVGRVSGPAVDAAWHPARLGPSPGPHAWVHWEYDWPVENPGFYVLRARATDDSGHVQPLEAEWNFRGVASNSVHAVPIEVRPE